MLKLSAHARTAVSTGMDSRGLREKGASMNNTEENDTGRDEVFAGRVL